jgi:AraC-like DNA-binding protein
LVCQSLTLHDLLTKLLKLHRTLLNGEQIWLTETQDSVWLHHRYTVPQNIPTYQGQYYTILIYLNAIRLAAGATWQPEELHLSGAHKLKGFFELESLANTRIYFYQPTNAIRLPKTMLSQPLIRLTNPVHPCTTEEVLNQTAPADDFPDSLSQLIRSLLPYGYPNLAVAADSAGVGLRTFQRRLQDHNLIYSTLVEQIRFERATELLQDRTLKLIDIAFELGYTDPANFSKAFKRWTGLSPREFRNLHLKSVTAHPERAIASGNRSLRISRYTQRQGRIAMRQADHRSSVNELTAACGDVRPGGDDPGCHRGIQGEDLVLSGLETT